MQVFFLSKNEFHPSRVICFLHNNKKVIHLVNFFLQFAYQLIIQLKLLADLLFVAISRLFVPKISIS